MRKIYLLQAMVMLMVLVGCASNSGDAVNKSSREDVTVTEEVESDEAVSNTTEHSTSESTTQESVSSAEATENASTESDKQESVEPARAAESTDSATADDYYSIWTNLSASEVEAFAFGVKEDILSGNWESLSQKISYPITVNGVTYSDSGAFSSEDWSSILNQGFLSEVQGETCHEMFSSWRGCMLGTGQVWISSVDGSLKVVAINL